MDPDPNSNIKVSIVGRPNVGKSTLFNRLTGSRKAITTDIPGTTRDRISESISINEIPIHLIDTGGLEYGKKDNIEGDVQLQAKLAIEESDIIIFALDGSSELTVDDFTAANILRKAEKDVILVANKCDNDQIRNQSYNIYELGFGEPICISAIHKLGIDELKNQIVKSSKKLKNKAKELIQTKENPNLIKLSFLGKPNAGKSSLFNAIVGSKKAIVSEIPGTTRDSIDTLLEYNKQKFKIIDTAGLKRRGKIKKGIEKFSSLRSLSSIEKSEIAVLVIDGEQGLTNQDLHIAEFVLKEEKGLIIAVNKFDLLEKDERLKNRIIYQIQKKLTFTPWAPLVFISAKSKKNIYKILELSLDIIKERKKRIDTSELNSFLQKTCLKHPPASAKYKKPKFLYATQADNRPPKFVMFFRNAKNLHFSYSRYLENEIRKEYGFNGTAIHINIRESSKKIYEKSKPN